MNYEQAVVKFLAQPENLPAALEVARQVEQVKDHLQVQFWSQYAGEMERRLQSADLVERWQVQATDERSRLGAYAACFIEYRSPKPRVVHLDVTLESGVPRSGYPLYFGLHWSRQYQEAYESTGLTDIRNKLSKLGFALNPNIWWLMYTHLRQNIRDDQFVIRLATEADQVIAEITDAVWTYFEQIREPLEAVNEALSIRTK